MCLILFRTQDPTYNPIEDLGGLSPEEIGVLGILMCLHLDFAVHMAL